MRLDYYLHDVFTIIKSKVKFGVFSAPGFVL